MVTENNINVGQLKKLIAAIEEKEAEIRALLEYRKADYARAKATGLEPIDDLLKGPEQISEYIGEPIHRTRDRLAAGKLPAFQTELDLEPRS